MRSWAIFSATLILFSVSFATSAPAQFFDAWGGNGWGGGYWMQPPFGGVGNLYGSGYLPVPPYYSIHPPVYYSGRIRRPYGDSPFAYAPERFRAPDVGYAPRAVDANDPPPQPQLIFNPFFEPATNTETAALEPATNAFVPSEAPVINTKPNVIENPTLDEQKPVPPAPVVPAAPKTNPLPAPMPPDAQRSPPAAKKPSKEKKESNKAAPAKEPANNEATRQTSRVKYPWPVAPAIQVVRNPFFVPAPAAEKLAQKAE